MGKKRYRSNLQDAYAQLLVIRSVIARGSKDFSSAIALGEQALQIVSEGIKIYKQRFQLCFLLQFWKPGISMKRKSSAFNPQRFSHQGSSSFITFTLLLNASALAIMRGQLHRAHDLNEEALRLTQTKSMERLAFLPTRFGRIHYFWNQLETKEIVTTALEQADLEHYTEAVICGQITLAWI